MSIGDLVMWVWNDGISWEVTRYSGIIVGSRLVKTDKEKIRIYSVLEKDGIVDVREDDIREIA